MPKLAGSEERLVVAPLEPQVIYYFALRTADEIPNWSDLSNQATGTTAAGVDVIPPAAVATLTTCCATPSSILLRWTAVGDDSSMGTAAQYDIRYSTIGFLLWDNMTRVTSPPVPGAPGQTDSMRVTGLAGDTTYYFRIKVADEVPNWSHLSNQATGATAVPPIGTFVLISSGTFLMGSPEDEYGRAADETQHQVTLTRAFYLRDHEVTQTEWQAVMGWNVSNHSGHNLPVETVTWFDCLVFCNRKSQGEGLTPAYTIINPYYQGIHIVSAGVTWDQGASGYRLPTEAEWEYACRAGSTTAYCNGGSEANLIRVGWYSGNSNYESHDVMTKDANAWGLKDMHGNVWEWCWDVYAPYTSGPVTDPMGAESGSTRVARGGGHFDSASDCRSAKRIYGWWSGALSGSVGFRICRTASGG